MQIADLLVQEVYSEVKLFLREYGEKIEAVNMSRLYEFPVNNKPCSEYLEVFLSNAYRLTLAQNDNYLIGHSKTDDLSEIYEQSGDGITNVDPVKQKIKMIEILSKKMQDSNVGVQIRFDNSILKKRASKNSAFFFEGEIVGSDIMLYIDEEKFEEIKCPKYKSIFLLAIILHELGHIVLSDNVLNRVLNSEELNCSSISDLVSVKDEKKAWIFSHAIRSMARASLEDEPEMSSFMVSSE